VQRNEGELKMAETKLTSGKGSMEQRIANRLRNSGCDSADVKTQTGTGPTRVWHNIHQRGQGPVSRRVDINAGGKPDEQG
jgi:hypothetical protein